MYPINSILTFTSLTHVSAAADLFGWQNIETKDYLDQWRKGFSIGFLSINDFEASEWRIILDTPEKVQWFEPQVGDVLRGLSMPDKYAVMYNDDVLKQWPRSFTTVKIIQRNDQPFPQPQDVKLGEGV